MEMRDKPKPKGAWKKKFTRRHEDKEAERAPKRA
jgi:hypothetical protein